VIAGAVSLTIVAPASSLGASPNREQVKLTRAGQAAARAIVLHRSDFRGEPGWKGKEQKPSYDATLACGTFHPNARDLVVHGDVDVTFTRGFESIDSEATVFDSPAMVRADWRRVITPALLPCLVKTIRAELPSGARVVSSSVLSFPRLAPMTRAYRVAIAVRGPAGKRTFTSDIVLVGTGRTEVSLSTIAYTTTPVMREEIRLSRAMVARVAA
jgi:hypothetical protein